MREYLQLTRAHTAPLETVPAIVGALLAAGGQITFGVVGWAIFGLLYHLAGYGMNSLVDWEKGYDQNDRNKLHHPLNRGTLSPSRARLVVGGLFFLLLALGVGLAWGELLALSALVLGALCGVAYNYLGKITDLKFIFIAISHTTVFVVPYLALGGDFMGREFGLGTLYVFIWVVFQITVSGDVMQLQEEDQSNFFRDVMGVYIQRRLGRPLDDDYVSFSPKSKLFSFSVKSVNLFMGAMLLSSLTGLYTLEMATFTAISSLCLFFTAKLVYDGRYMRDDRVRRVAAIEVLTMVLLVISVSPVIGLGAVVMLILGSFVWIGALNRIEWGTWLRPDV